MAAELPLSHAGKVTFGPCKQTRRNLGSEVFLAGSTAPKAVGPPYRALPWYGSPTAFGAVEPARKTSEPKFLRVCLQGRNVILPAWERGGSAATDRTGNWTLAACYPKYATRMFDEDKDFFVVEPRNLGSGAQSLLQVSAL